MNQRIEKVHWYEKGKSVPYVEDTNEMEKQSSPSMKRKEKHMHIVPRYLLANKKRITDDVPICVHVSASLLWHT